MIFRWTYQIILAVLVLLYLPKALYDLLTKGKYRSSLWQRLGLTKPSYVPSRDTPLIWIHAVSVGETKAIAALAHLIKQRHPHYRFVISSMTETGHAEAQNSLPFANAFVYFPIDLTWCIRPLLRQFAPKVVLISETDIWWNFLRLCKEQGANIGVINAKLSERSYRRLMRFFGIGKKLYESIDLCCAQTEEYATRLKALQIPTIVVTGNTKFDHKPSTFAQILPVQKEDQWIVIGSTHEGEEEALLSQLIPLLERYSFLRVAIAPRHPERFLKVLQLLKSYPISSAALSQGPIQQERLILIDQMGVLRSLYTQATMAIVGGSFFPKVGGHHILEPCLEGCPVLFGPYMHSQKEMVELVKQFHTGEQVSLEEIMSSVEHIVSSPELQEFYKINCRQISQQIKGATERTYTAVSSWF